MREYLPLDMERAHPGPERATHGRSRAQAAFFFFFFFFFFLDGFF
ncbi:hypothetical protein ACU686_01920 [Yinghuangia aomiensis]